MSYVTSLSLLLPWAQEGNQADLLPWEQALQGANEMLNETASCELLLRSSLLPAQEQRPTITDSAQGRGGPADQPLSYPSWFCPLFSVPPHPLVSSQAPLLSHLPLTGPPWVTLSSHRLKRAGKWGTWGSESLLVIIFYILASSVHAVASAYTSASLISLRGSCPEVHTG